MEPAKESVWGGGGEEVKKRIKKKKLKGESLACLQASLPGPLFLTPVINGKAPTCYTYINSLTLLCVVCHPSIHPFIHPSIHSSIHSSIHPSIHPSMILALQVSRPLLLNTGGFGRWICSQ
jgi:hypothetical protein